jgi:hypothetical protein
VGVYGATRQGQCLRQSLSTTPRWAVYARRHRSRRAEPRAARDGAHGGNEDDTMNIILVLTTAIIYVSIISVVWYIGWGPPVFRRDIEDWPDVGT